MVSGGSDRGITAKGCLRAPTIEAVPGSVLPIDYAEELG